MKNKFKKIIPLILCFVLVAGSCLTVNAAKVSSKKYLEGDSFVMLYETDNLNNGDYRGYEITITLSSVQEEVRVVPLSFEYSSTNKQVGYLMVSKKPFKYSSFENQWYNRRDDYLKDYSNVITNSSGPNSASSLAYNGTTYYYAGIAFSLQPANLSPTFGFSYINMSDYVSGYYKTDSVKGEFFEKMYLADFTWEDGIEMEYGTVPIVDILPPSNVSYFEAERPALQDYYFQLDWDNENTEDLNVEIAMDIKYKSNYLSFNENIIRCSWIDYYDYLMSSTGKKDGYVRELAKSMLESLDIKYSESHITIDSFYIRFVRENSNTGQLEYSLWTKLYLNRNDKWYEPLINSSNGNTGYFDSEGNWIEQSVVNGGFVDGSEDVPIISPGLDMDGNNASPGYPNNFNPGNWDSNFSNVFDSFTNAIKSAMSFVGEFPAMISEFFGFLPASVIGVISIGLIMAVLLRFLGR